MSTNGTHTDKENVVVASHALAVDPNQQYEAARSTCGLHERDDLGFIEVTGPDGPGFLHRLLSNDVKKLTDGQGNMSFLLTPKGKVIAELHVLRRSPESVVMTSVSTLPSDDPDRPQDVVTQVIEELEKYHFAEELELHDRRRKLLALEIFGPKAPELLGALTTQTSDLFSALAANNGFSCTIGDAEVTVVRVSDLESDASLLPGWRLIAPIDSGFILAKRIVDVGEAFGLSLLGDEPWQWLRVEAGTPLMGAELTDATVPLEARLESHVDFHKGCYVGQETIAKMDARGRPARLLTAMLPDGPLPDAGTELFTEDRPRACGWITSAVKTPRFPDGIALGYVKTDLSKRGTKLLLGSASGNDSVSVTDYPPTPKKKDA